MPYNNVIWRCRMLPIRNDILCFLHDIRVVIRNGRVTERMQISTWGLRLAYSNSYTRHKLDIMRILPKKTALVRWCPRTSSKSNSIFFPVTFKYLYILHVLSSESFKQFISTCWKIYYSIFGRVSFERNARYLKFQLSKHANNISRVHSQHIYSVPNQVSICPNLKSLKDVFSKRFLLLTVQNCVILISKAHNIFKNQRLCIEFKITFKSRQKKN